jgi:ribosomal protein S18 acetylase RimI-like enzyme
METLLRSPKAAEAPRIAEVLLASRGAFLPFAPFAHTAAEVRQWVQEVLLPTSQVTVAVVDGAAVGVLAVSSKEGQSWIEQLHIHPTHVGQAIGSQLLAHAVATAPLPIRLYTFQQNERARKFYERHGFVAVELSDGIANEERCPDVLYEMCAAPPEV